VSNDFYLGFPEKKDTSEPGFLEPVGFSLIFNKDQFREKPVENLKDVDDEALAEAIEESDGFHGIQTAFFEQRLAFTDILPISHTAVHMGKSVICTVLEKEIKSFARQTNENVGDWRVYTFDNELFSVVSRSVSKAKRQIDSMWVFPNIFLMGLVSQYDAFFGSLIRELTKSKPHIIMDSNRQFSAKEVFEYTDVEAFRTAVVEKEVEAVLRSSHEEQLSWLEKRSGVPLTNDLEILPSFIEICERRNLFAHTNGIVSEQYLFKCKSAEFDTSSKIGDQLRADADYLYDASKIFLEMGIKLCQVLWRTSSKSAESDSLANQSLSDIGYGLIVHEEYALAASLLSFGLSKPFRHPDSITKSMITVNLANAYKLSNNQEDADRVLNAVDWGPYQLHFQICVAAIRSDIDKFVELLPGVPEANIRPEDYVAWPVFKPLRSDARFVAALEDRFGESLVERLRLESNSVDGKVTELISGGDA